MSFITKCFTFASLCLLVTGALAADHNSTRVVLKGKGVYALPNLANQGFDIVETSYDILAKGDHLKKGALKISTSAVSPTDPVTGSSFEAIGVVDSIRVFAAHPDIVWIHGYMVPGGQFITGTSPLFGPTAGRVINLTTANGEFIGAIAKFARTSIVTLAETDTNFLPSFALATETQLISTVKGFTRALLTNTSKPEVSIRPAPDVDIYITN